MFEVNTEHSTGVLPQLIGARFYHREPTHTHTDEVSLCSSGCYGAHYDSPSSTSLSVGTKGLHHYTQLEGIIIFIRAPSKEMCLYRTF